MPYTPVYTLALFQSTLPVGGGTKRHSHLCENGRFQSTLPVGGGTRFPLDHTVSCMISIHPPRGGRDSYPHGSGHYGRYFNPPSPWGEGRKLWTLLNTIIIFQSTLPVGGGTTQKRAACVDKSISIHPPRGGRDLFSLSTIFLLIYFNPPSPWGEGRYTALLETTPQNFNPPSPWGEGHGQNAQSVNSDRISIHPPRGGRDSKSTQKFFSISCTFDKFSRIFRHHILFSGRESKKQAANLSKSQCEGLREILGASPSHRSRPSESRRDRSRVSPHSG